MKLYQTSNFIFFCTIVFLLSGCSKQHSKEDPKLSFTKRALEYVVLTEGKYLVYEDSASLTLDSVVVTKSSLEDYYYKADEASTLIDFLTPSTPSHYGQKFNLILTKHNGATQTEWFNGTAITEFAAFSIASSDTTLLALHSNAPYDTSSSFYMTESTNADYSLVVAAHSYSQVAISKHVNYFDPSDPLYKSSTYYWAKGIGIIRIRITHGTESKTYNLVRHN